MSGGKDLLNDWMVWEGLTNHVIIILGACGI